jgi:hypothetical protein
MRSELRFESVGSAIERHSLSSDGDIGHLMIGQGAVIDIHWVEHYPSIKQIPTFHQRVCTLKNNGEKDAKIVITALSRGDERTLNYYRIDIFADIGAIEIKNPPEIIKDGGLIIVERDGENENH